MVPEATIVEAGARLTLAAGSSAEVILFGSHARGDAGPNSDLDFLVIQPTVTDELGEAVRLRRTLRGLKVPADVSARSVARHASGFAITELSVSSRVSEQGGRRGVPTPRRRRPRRSGRAGCALRR